MISDCNLILQALLDAMKRGERLPVFIEAKQRCTPRALRLKIQERLKNRASQKREKLTSVFINFMSEFFDLFVLAEETKLGKFESAPHPQNHVFC